MATDDEIIAEALGAMAEDAVAKPIALAVAEAWDGQAFDLGLIERAVRALAADAEAS